MKKLLFALSLAISSQLFGQTDKAIFLHHSTGGAVFADGNVEQWISNYNSQNGTNYTATEFAYPNSPWGWENYPYDYWKLWIDGSCDNNQENIQCLDRLCQNYELIVFKHCFPGASIDEDSGTGDITSSAKTLNNYKLQYRALLQLFDQYPNNKFMVWTLAPLHRNATNAQQAQRAAEFVEWVKNTWLTEGGKSHPNVSVFDFFGYVAETNALPANGVQYCLKYEYEGDHNGSDSHPNQLANQTVGPLFAAEMVNTMARTLIRTNDQKTGQALQIQADPTTKTISYQLNTKLSVDSNLIEVFTMLGERVYLNANAPVNGKISLPNKSGVYLFRAKINGVFISRKVIL